MRELFTKGSMLIAPGQAVAGKTKQTYLLRVQRGRVWMTMEGELEDYWLMAGDEIMVLPRQLTVIEADAAAGPAGICVVASNMRSGTVGNWLRRLITTQPALSSSAA